MAVANQKLAGFENVLMSEIEVDYKWNIRSSTETGDTVAESDPKGDKEFKESIALGQDTPVWVRKKDPKDMKKGEKPYFLVAGFRRYKALSELATERGDKAATIKAEIKNYSDAEARIANVRENTGREDLAGADLCFGIGRIADGDKKLSGNAIATLIGANQSYVAKMIRFWRKIPMSILKDWRSNPGGRAVTIAQMTLVEELRDKEGSTAADQEALYNKLKASKVKKDPNPDAWIDGAVANAKVMGEILGKLSRNGHLEIVGDDFFGDNIGTLVKLKKDASGESRQKVADACEAAFTAAMTSDETEAEKSEAAAASAGKGRPKKKSANNGAAPDPRVS